MRNGSAFTLKYYNHQVPVQNSCTGSSTVPAGFGSGFGNAANAMVQSLSLCLNKGACGSSGFSCFKLSLLLRILPELHISHCDGWYFFYLFYLCSGRGFPCLRESEQVRQLSEGGMKGGMKGRMLRPWEQPSIRSGRARGLGAPGRRTRSTAGSWEPAAPSETEQPLTRQRSRE